jgi:hypothetical protein
VTDSLTRLVLRAQGQLPIAEPLLPSRYAPAVMVRMPDWEAPAIVEAEAPALPTTASRTPHLGRPAPEHQPSTPQENQTLADAATAPVNPLIEGFPGQAEAALQRIEPGRPRAAAFADAVGQTPRSAEVVASAVSLPAVSSRTGFPEVVDVSRESAVGHSAPALPAARASDRLADSSEVAPVLSEPARVPSELTPSATRPPPGMPPERLWLPNAPARQPANGRAAMPPDFPVRQTQPAPPDVQISIGVVEVHAAPPRPAPARPAPARPRQVSLADYLAQRRGRSQ